jgi:L-serine kinase (ADP)
MNIIYPSGDTIHRMNIQTISLEQIHQHEEIDKHNLQHVMTMIQKSKVFKEPIIVDKKSLVILDGHHRFNSCKKLGLHKIPCILVDYLKDTHIRVTSRRKKIDITKEIVVKMGLSGNLFPKKTTKHFIPKRVKKLHIPISELRNN